MTFTSLFFLFGALPLFLLIYYFSKPCFHIYELLIFSGWFYYMNDPTHLKWIIFQILFNYLLSVMILYSKERKYLSRFILLGGIVSNSGLLFACKFVGQSFYTFALIAYLVDVYQKKITPPKNPFKFADYILMFPKLLMGPIVLYKDLEDNLDRTKITISDIGNGAKRFMVGFFKKVIIADNLAILFSEINSSGDFANMTVIALWIGSFAYSLELFFDFSGYSDMAIGLARMLGLRFGENFNYPYCCKSLTDFWRRWHISLSKWFRDYVYIPLGGSRKGLARNLFNLLVVWLLTGIWHGTGYAFIAWGLIYFCMLSFERYVIKPDKLKALPAYGWRIVSLLIVNFNWVLFSHSGIKTGIRYCLGMIGIYYRNNLCAVTDVRLIREYGLYLLLGMIFSTPIAKYFEVRIQSNKTLSKCYVLVMPVIYAAIFIWALSFIMLGYHNPFMYQKF